MEYRRLQQTGGQKVDGEKKGGSFLIILPKNWIDHHGLKKGDSVAVAEREDGCLIIDPRIPKAGETRFVEVFIEPNLRWTITSKYLLGFDEIRVLSKKPITNAQRDELKRIIKRFVALEVTDESENQIVIQCLVDPSILPVIKTMKRMNLITTRMFHDALDAYFAGNTELGQDVIARDEEVDRLFFLIVRELRSAIQYPRMSEAMGVTPVAALDLRLATQYIERIADLSVDIANKVDKSLDKDVAQKLQSIAEQVKKMHLDAVSNLFKFNPDKVAWVISAENEITDQIARIRQDIITQPNGEPQSQLSVVDSLLRIAEASKDIADLALPTN
ncbi:MAG: PhoU domain-containing protein [Candidatus Thorarchaeota archaeon]